MHFNNTSSFFKFRCGEPNMYMQGYNCKVTNSTSIIPLAKPNAPKWCEDAPKNCTQGAKQIIAWNQESGNNIEVSGFDKSGNNKSPGYNIKCGFKDGEFVKVFFSLAFFSSSLYQCFLFFYLMDI